MENVLKSSKGELILIRGLDQFCIGKGRINIMFKIFKHFNISHPFDFSYFSKDSELISTLTLKENLVLQGLPKHLGEESEIDIEKIIKNQNNDMLDFFISGIGDLDKHPENATTEEKQRLLFSISLLRKSPFLILDNPEDNLKNLQLKVIQTICNHIKISSSKVFLFTDDAHPWSEYLTKIIYWDSSKGPVIEEASNYQLHNTRASDQINIDVEIEENQKSKKEITLDIEHLEKKVS